MSTAVREKTSSHTSRKIVSHSGAISGQTQPTSTANSLENNLDALLEDLQTSVSRSTTPNRGRTLSPQVEYRVAANPTKVVSEGRSLSPMKTMTTSTEKYVSTGPSGAPSGIPGLDFIDNELQNVQPGQSKTIAYKQVSYQYNKNLDGKPIDSWTVPSPNVSSAMVDNIRERTYEESTLHRGIEPAPKTVNRELMYSSDSSLSRSKQASPLPGTQQKEVKYIHESSYQTEAPPTLHPSSIQEYGGVEYVPVPSPTPAIPINLAPGPNTKVTTTIKTYTYELPGAPGTYLPGSKVPGTVLLPGDQTITYTIPKGTTATDKVVAYQSSENLGGKVSSRFGSPSPVEKKSTSFHQEAKFYREEHHGGGYQSPPLESKISRSEKYYQQVNGHPPDTIIYENQPQIFNETHTTIDRVEERYSGNRQPFSEKPATPVNYYTPSQPNQTTVYKFANNTSTVPPNKNPEDHEVLLPKFPTGDVGVHSGKPGAKEQEPPKKLEDLMASFSDTEREVLEKIEKREKQQRKESPSVKKEVDFIPHTPPKVKSKNVAGPPVYYPPGSAEFTKKEESGGAMAQSSGAWQKASGKYEYEASSKSKSKSSSGGAVIPVCLPLCCALPCTIM